MHGARAVRGSCFLPSPELTLSQLPFQRSFWKRCFNLQKIVNDRAVMNHGRAQLLGGRVVSCGARNGGACRAIGSDQLRMVDGKVGGALFKAFFRKSARLQKRRDQFVGFNNGTPGMVDEAGLHQLPCGYIVGSLGLREVVNLEELHAFLSIQEPGFCIAPGCGILNDKIIFRSKALAEMFCSFGSVPGDNHDSH